MALTRDDFLKLLEYVIWRNCKTEKNIDLHFIQFNYCFNYKYHSKTTVTEVK